jgi:hypothetical protein
VNHGLSLYLTITVLVGIHSLANSRNVLVRNRVNNLKKIAKENFEINLDNIILENASNNKTYWKIMKHIKSLSMCKFGEEEQTTQWSKEKRTTIYNT